MLDNNSSLGLSPYSDIYDLVVPKDNFWRQLKESSDFSGAVRAVSVNYSQNMGRTAISPEVLLKLLIIKEYYEWSDNDTIEEVRVNLAYRLFVGVDLDQRMPDKTTLSYFRRIRLQNADVATELLKASVKAAVAKGLIRVSDKGRMLIKGVIDATHTDACCKRMWANDVLPRRCRDLIKAVIDSALISWTEQIDVPVDMDSTEAVEFATALIESLKATFPQYEAVPAVSHIVNRMEEEINEFKEHGYTSYVDKDARVGYKSNNYSFFGYKSHLLADVDSGIVIGQSVTPGNESDTLAGEALVKTICESDEVDMEYLMGDSAYSSAAMLDIAAEHEFELVATPNATLGTCKAFDHGFKYTKDADAVICPAGNLSVSKKKCVHIDKKSGRKYHFFRFNFDKTKCETCPLKSTCYVSHKKSPCVEIAAISEQQAELLRRYQTADFKQKFRQRSAIERINADIKQNQSMRKAMAPGLHNMTLQSAIAIFTYNMRKIFTKLKK